VKVKVIGVPGTGDLAQVEPCVEAVGRHDVTQRGDGWRASTITSSSSWSSSASSSPTWRYGATMTWPLA
jgi:hypothetical protein